MITLSENAIEAVQALRASIPGREWYLRVWWDRGDVEEVRSAEGGAEFLRGIPHGWSVEPCAYHPLLEQRLSFSIVAGVKVCVELAAPAAFAFRGGMVDADGARFYIAP